MDLSMLTTNAILLFLLLLTRVGGMFLSAPFFSQQGVPTQVKVYTAVIITFIIFPLHVQQAALPATELWTFSFLMLQELAIGLMLGFLAGLFFAGIQMAGNHLSTQMGLGVAHALDPVSNQQSPIMGQFLFVMAIMAFLSMNIHHTLIVGVVKSLEAIPIATPITNFPEVSGRMMTAASQMFSYSVMLVLPVFGIMLVLEIALAFMAKLMPQMNIFMVAMPLKILVALIILYVTLPFIAEALHRGFGDLAKQLLFLYRL